MTTKVKQSGLGSIAGYLDIRFSLMTIVATFSLVQGASAQNNVITPNSTDLIQIISPLRNNGSLVYTTPTLLGTGGLTTGSAVVGGSSGCIVYDSSTSVVACDSGFTKADGATGVVTLGNGGASTPQLTFAPNSGNAISLGMANSGGQLIVYNQLGAQQFGISSSQTLLSNGRLQWTNSAASVTTTIDTTISRQGAGVIQIGTTAANALGSLLFTNMTASGASINLTGINATTETDILCFNTSTGLVTHSTVAQQCTVSDVNKKQDIASIDPERALRIVLALDPISFRYKPEADMGTERHIGFTMQRVAAIAPELATDTGVKYGELSAIWAAAIQALDAKFEAYKRSHP